MMMMMMMLLFYLLWMIPLQPILVQVTTPIAVVHPFLARNHPLLLPRDSS
jgi:hypothetical protein